MPNNSQRTTTHEREISYQFRMNRDDWRTWTNTIPRTTPIHERLKELIELDTHLSVDNIDAPKANLLEMKSERLERLSSQAQNALTERENPEQALEKLSKIEEIADSIHIKHTDD